MKYLAKKIDNEYIYSFVMYLIKKKQYGREKF